MAEIEPRLRPRTLTVSGVAKAYAMMGWRIGYAGGPKALVRQMVNIQSQTTSCPSSISQAAAIAALNGPQQLLRDRAGVLRAKRDRLVEIVNGCTGLACSAPEGTFFLLISCAGVLGKRAEARQADRNRPGLRQLSARARRSGGVSGRGLRTVGLYPDQLRQPVIDDRGGRPTPEKRLRGLAMMHDRNDA